MTVYLLFGLILLYGPMALATNMDPENGTPETSIYRIYLPHNLIKEGDPYLNLSIHIQQMPYENITCQQNLLDTLQMVLCTHHVHNHRHVITLSYTLKCIDNVTSVRGYGCVTYDNDSCSVLSIRVRV